MGHHGQHLLHGVGSPPNMATPELFDKIISPPSRTPAMPPSPLESSLDLEDATAVATQNAPITIRWAHSLECDSRPQFLAWYQEQGDDPLLSPHCFSQYYSSRLALKRCLKAAQIPLERVNWPQLAAIHHYPPTGPPGPLLTSLTHTRAQGLGDEREHTEITHLGAAALAQDEQWRSLGVDLEPCKRAIAKDIVGKIGHPRDADYPPLALWGLKEAAYKALWPLVADTASLRFCQIQITPRGMHLSTENLRGHLQLKIISVAEVSYQLAIAAI